MEKYARRIDGSTPIRLQLYTDEELVGSQSDVGLYNGKDKSLEHQSGTVHITTHRLFYIDTHRPASSSVAINLANVRQTDYYAGFLTSSAKVNLNLSPAHSADSVASGSVVGSSPSAPVPIGLSAIESPVPKKSRFFNEAWVCTICSFSNPPSAAEGHPKCQLCGMTRDSSVSAARSTAATPLPIPIASTTNFGSDRGLSKSLPSHILPSPPSTSSPTFPLQPTGSSKPISCPTCTFLNHPSMKLCELCSTPLRSYTAASQAFKADTSAIVRAPTPSESTSTSPYPSPTPDLIRISFRKGGDKTFYSILRKTLLGKAWETSSSTSRPRTGIVEGGRETNLRSGIQGVLDAAEDTAHAQSEDLSGSLKDLEILMSKAKEMVQMAQTLNEKLTAQEEAVERQKLMQPGLSSTTQPFIPEEVKFLRKSMAQLGLASAAITQDMVKDERLYEEELAKELIDVLLGHGRNGTGLLGAHNGIISLDEVWCGWNRARGVALIPPSLLVSVLTQACKVASGKVNLRTFSSGLSVLHDPRYSHKTFSARLRQTLAEYGPKMTMDVARQEEMTVGLSEQLIEAVEDDAEIVRDDPGGHEPLRWHLNSLRDFVYDGTT